MSEKSLQIMIVDDDPAIGRTLKKYLQSEGHKAVFFTDPSEAIDRCLAAKPDLVFTDLKMPGMDGVALMKRMKRISPSSLIVLITGHGTVPSAVEAIKEGAYDYLLKPFELDDIDRFVQKVRSLLNNKKEDSNDKKQEYQFTLDTSDWIGKSAWAKAIRKKALKAAKVDSVVLITGPTGCGKEVLAQAIHHSGKPQGDFSAINCAAIPPALLESELFGHKKGSFTGALCDTPGRFLAAGDGTLFLDEIGELPLPLQAKLLRVLQSREVIPVGGTEAKKINARLIAASNRNLEVMSRDGGFREDLYYRLAVLTLYIPPLKDRLEDIPPLIDFFHKKNAAQFKTDKKKFTSSAMQEILSKPWKGNIRELENFIERIYALDLPNSLGPAELPFLMDLDEEDKTLTQPESLREMEALTLQRALKKARGVKSSAAQILGIGRNQLYRLIEKYKIRE